MINWHRIAWISVAFYIVYTGGCHNVDLDELEDLKGTTVEVEDHCDPCQVKGRSCLNCEWLGQVEKTHTWTPRGGSLEPMRLCFNFVEFVPARAAFYCSLWEPRRT